MKSTLSEEPTFIIKKDYLDSGKVGEKWDMVALGSASRPRVRTRRTQIWRMKSELIEIMHGVLTGWVTTVPKLPYLKLPRSILREAGNSVNRKQIVQNIASLADTLRVPYAALAKVFALIEATTKRLDTMRGLSSVSELLSKLTSGHLIPYVFD